MKKLAFISYAHEPETRRAAVQLAERLRKDGVNVWFDQWNLQPGQPWEPAINTALEQASAILAIVGKSDRSKGMLKKELEVAIKANKAIIPILTDDADFNDIPESIRDRQAVAPNSGRPAYLQLLRALGKETSDTDDIDSLTFIQRLRRYLANE
jgi:hypothetical protein